MLNFNQSIELYYEFSDDELWDYQDHLPTVRAAYDPKTGNSCIAAATTYNYLHSLNQNWDKVPFEVFLKQFLSSSFHEYMHYVLDNFTDVEKSGNHHKIIKFLQLQINN